MTPTQGSHFLKLQSQKASDQQTDQLAFTRLSFHHVSNNLLPVPCFPVSITVGLVIQPENLSGGSFPS